MLLPERPCVYLALLAVVATLVKPLQAEQTPLTAEPLIVPGSNPPTVKLDNGTFIGIMQGRTSQFLGIPFAKPPTGDLRFRLPVEHDFYKGNSIVRSYGLSCPQQRVALPERSPASKPIADVFNAIAGALMPDAEDCLTLNVIQPIDAKLGSNLPVVVWIFGGGFEIGGSSVDLYDGRRIVERSLDIGQPVVFVSINYRLNAFGFLGGKEVRKAGIGNLGLQDQRIALRWVQKYIANFGGDPSKVTIWGESAGAISVALHMLTNDGDNEGLFRGGIMQSGGPIPVGPIENGQKYYDNLVRDTGCTGSQDTLECLRRVPYKTLKAAVGKSPSFMAYQGLDLAWLPRVDGKFLKMPPHHQVLTGKVTDVPFITGNCDDEGTLFSVQTFNITTTSELRDWLKTYFWPKVDENVVDLLLQYYPDIQSAGSPFDTGIRNMLGPQFKRLAALQGDGVFHGPRRFFLKYRANKSKAWSFLSKRNKATPYLGSVHASDIFLAFLDWELRDYIIRFVNSLDPNGKQGLGIPWPQYDLADPKNMVFEDSTLRPMRVLADDYRQRPLEFITNLTLLSPI